MVSVAKRMICAARKLDKGTGCKSRTVTAAVSAEAISVGESQSLGKPEKAGYGRRRESSISVSQKTYKGRYLLSLWIMGFVLVRRKTAAAIIRLPQPFCILDRFAKIGYNPNASRSYA